MICASHRWSALPVVGLLVLLASVPRQLAAQAPLPAERWWVDVGMGYGSLTLDPRGAAGDATGGTYALRFSGGRAFGPRLRVGLSLGGWLLEAFDPWDPAEGEAISDFSLVVQGQPFARAPLVLEAGVGRASYTNSAPTGSDAAGSNWTLGVGYVLVTRGRLRLVPSVHVGGGSFGRPDDPAGQSAEGYTVREARLGATWVWGGGR